MPKPPTVFISYHRESSSDLARYIYEELTRRGADVFFDVEDINGGRFDATIEREIINREHLLVILAPRTLRSEWVRREIETALRHGKNIIPVETDRFNFDRHVPPELAELKNFGGVPYDFKSPETTFKRLSRALNLTPFAVGPPIPSVSPLPTESLETERRLDAATHSQTKISDKTEIEVRVKIVQPNSRGLEVELPAVAISGDIIQKDNVVPSTFPIQFEKDDSGRLFASLCVKLQADGFKVRSDFSKGYCGTSAVAIELSANTDSPTIIFFLSPKATPQPQSVSIRVSVLQKGILIAQVPLRTELVRQVERITLLEYWNFVSVILTEKSTQSHASPFLPPVFKTTFGCRGASITGIVTVLGLMLTFLALFPEQTRTTWLHILGLLPPTATGNADWIPQFQSFNGVDMALVPIGCFDMGSNNGSDDEKPVHEQCFDQPFWIDRTEVTRTQYRECVAGGACTEKPVSEFSTGPDQPINRATWLQARTYCQWRSVRLPTEREWEYAARGPDNLIYPWGNDFLADNVVYAANSGRQTAKVGSKPDGISWVGAFDLSGNVWEWVSTIPQPYPYKADDGREVNTDSADILRGLRGGSFFSSASDLRAANRGSNNPSYVVDDVGFRCARDY